MTVAFPQDNVLLPTGKLSQSWQRFFQNFASQTGDVVQYTPVVFSMSGDLVSAGGFARYQKIGRQIVWWAEIVVTNNGTGSDAIGVTLPSDAFFPTKQTPGSGYQASTPGVMLQVSLGLTRPVPPGGVLYTAVLARNYDGTYPAVGSNIYLKIVYELV